MASDNSIRGVAGTGARLRIQPEMVGQRLAHEIAFAGPCVSTPKGDVVFSDGSFNIRTFPIGGNLSTIAGDGWPNFFGDNGPAQQAGLAYPFGVATDAQGNVYVADREISAYARSMPLRRHHHCRGRSNAAKRRCGSSSPPLQPFAVALDQSNHLYVRSAGVIKSVDLHTGTSRLC